MTPPLTRPPRVPPTHRSVTIHPKNTYDQECGKGPITPLPLGHTWRHHLIALWGWLTLAMIIIVMVYYNLTLLYQFNPGYGRSLEMERAFCEEVNKTFVSSYYVFDETSLECVDPCYGVEKENPEQDYYWYEPGQTCLPVGMEAKR